jgi:glycosyltransferase involved in cell wall biosynthesis
LWIIDHVCYDGSLHGGGRLFMNLIPEFDSSRVRIHPFFLRASPEVQEVFKEAQHPVINLDKSKYDVTALTKISSLCSELEIDVMHTFCYAASTFGRLVGAFRGIPTIIHDFDTQVYFPYPMYLRILDRMLANKTARGFAASSMCRDYMRDVRRVPGEIIDILYHAIPKELLDLAQLTDVATEREKLGWKSGSTVYACITKLGPDRGNETLLKSFRSVIDKTPSARLALIYKPTLYHRVPAEYEHIPWIRDVDSMRQHIEQKIRYLGLEDHVDLIETSDSMHTYYAACDVIVAPFENGRFSSVNLVEALAFGKPFIATELGEPLEIHSDHGVGIMVPPGDEKALATAMLRIANDPTRLAELSRQALEVSGEFTVKASARRFEGLYESLAIGSARKVLPESRSAAR